MSSKDQSARIFETDQEVLDLHQKEGKKIVIYQGVVYDIEEYINTHPGGSEVLENEFGKHIDEPFEEAEHTKAAKKIFNDLPIVGRMKDSDATSTNSSNGEKADKQFKEGCTGLTGGILNSKLDFDYNKGLFWQMAFTDWTYDEYYQYINEPKHLVNPVRSVYLFEFTPLEIATKTPYWLIPIAFIPHVVYHYSLMTMPPAWNALIFLIGFFSWTILEYLLHRFLFHSEDQSYFIRHPKFYTAHFLLHGIHHAFPNDKYRIVFPPILGYPMHHLVVDCIFQKIITDAIFHPWVCGVTVGYVCYDSIHYQLHASNPREGTKLKEMKKDHMQHHYKNGSVGFGVTQRFWDNVFNTPVTVESVRQKKQI